MHKSRFEIPFTLLRLISWIVLKPFFGFEIHGLQYLRSCKRGVILAGNHTGFLDSLTLYVACQRYFRFVMTEEVFTWGLLGKLVPHGNIIPLYQGRERRALIDTVQLLQQGAMVCIFPEGKLTQDGQMNPFNEGTAFLQQKSGAPILPFVIHGGFEAWSQNRKWPNFRKIILQFGEPIEAGLYQNRRDILQALESRVHQMKAAWDEREQAGLNTTRPAIRRHHNAPLPLENPSCQQP